MAASYPEQTQKLQNETEKEYLTAACKSIFNTIQYWIVYKLQGKYSLWVYKYH